MPSHWLISVSRDLSQPISTHYLSDACSYHGNAHGVISAVIGYCKSRAGQIKGRRCHVDSAGKLMHCSMRTWGVRSVVITSSHVYQV